MHTNLETIVTDFNEARGGDEDGAQALEGASDIGKVTDGNNNSEMKFAVIREWSQLVRQGNRMECNGSVEFNLGGKVIP